MLKLNIENTPEQVAVAQQLIDSLRSANISFKAKEESNESISFTFEDLKEQSKVINLIKYLGLDMTPTPEDDAQKGKPLYRTESYIDQFLSGKEEVEILNEICS